MRLTQSSTSTVLQPAPAQGGLPAARDVLRWVYIVRLSLATAIYLAVVFQLQSATPADLVLVSVGLVTALVVTGASAWYSHVRHATPMPSFLYAQAVFDLALVTGVVHVTGGPGSVFFAFYMIVIAFAAVLMPLASTLLVALFAAMVYFADIAWGHPFEMSPAVGLQLAVFITASTAAAYLGNRVRQGGMRTAVLERELSRVQLEAADILRNIRSGVLTVDGEGRLLYANPATEELLGLKPHEWSGQSILEYLSEISPQFRDAIEATGQRGVRVTRAEAAVHLAGRTFPVGLTATALQDAPEGGQRAVTAIFSDISSQKRLDELRMRTERLEAVAALSASLAHEIKNPLASIRSSVEQLGRSSRSDPDERYLAELVVRESDRLSRLLTEFLDFSRVTVTAERVIQLRKLVQAVTRLVQEHPDYADTARIDIHGDELKVLGDEDLLHRTLMNLLLNAVQAGGPQVHVTVKLRRLTPAELPRGVRMERPIMIEISDNGPGIPPDVRDRIFDPFVTGRVGGSGLGLAIVERAVQAHRGVILVRSNPSDGATFTILLPAAGRGAAKREPRPQQAGTPL